MQIKEISPFLPVIVLSIFSQGRNHLHLKFWNLADLTQNRVNIVDKNIDLFFGFLFQELRHSGHETNLDSHRNLCKFGYYHMALGKGKIFHGCPRLLNIPHIWIHQYFLISPHWYLHSLHETERKRILLDVRNYFNRSELENLVSIIF